MSPSIKQLIKRTLPDSGSKFRISARGEIRLSIDNHNLDITEDDILTFNFTKGDIAFGNNLRMIHDRSGEAVIVPVSGDIFKEVILPTKERK